MGAFWDTIKEPWFEKKIIETDSATGITYFWFADKWTATSTAKWQIQKLVEATVWTVTTTTYTRADWNAHYDNIWDNRASLSYS